MEVFPYLVRELEQIAGGVGTYDEQIDVAVGPFVSSGVRSEYIYVGDWECILDRLLNSRRVVSIVSIRKQYSVDSVDGHRYGAHRARTDFRPGGNGQ